MASSSTQIVKVLRDLEHNADDCATAKMFLAALPNMFGGERHDFQQRLSSMLRDTLNQAREKQAGKHAAGVTHLNETNARMEKMREERNAAEAHVESSKVTVEEKSAALSDKRKKTKMAAECHKDTVRDNKLLETEYLTLEESKIGIDSIISGSLSMLVAGSWDSEEARDDFVKPVMYYLQEEMVCDRVLLASLRKALGCSPEKRGAFAKLAVEEAVKQLNAQAARISASLEDSKVKFEEAKAENLGAWAIADVARDEENIASNQYYAAEANKQQAIDEKKIALSKLTDVEKEVEVVTAEQASIEVTIGEIDAALSEMVQLENEVAEKNKENVDTASPAAKRMKLSEDSEIAPVVVSVQ